MAMAQAMLAMAVVQAMAGLVTLLVGGKTVALSAFFVAVWLTAAALFRKAAREP